MDSELHRRLNYDAEVVKSHIEDVIDALNPKGSGGGGGSGEGGDTLNQLLEQLIDEAQPAPLPPPPPGQKVELLKPGQEPSGYDHIAAEESEYAEKPKRFPKEYYDHINQVEEPDDAAERAVQIGSLYLRLRSIMVDNKFDRHVSDQKRGLIYSPQVWKALTTKRIFQKKLEREHKEYDVVLLLDTSGSMDDIVYDENGNEIGSRLSIVGTLAGVLSASLERLGINFCVLVFANHVYLAKDWGEHYHPSQWFRLRELVNIAQGKTGGGTEYARALWAARQALYQRQGERLLLMFTDGNGFHSDAKREWKLISHIAKAQCFGIGEDPGMSGAIILRTVEDFVKEVKAIFRKVVRRG